MCFYVVDSIPCFLFRQVNINICQQSYSSLPWKHLDLIDSSSSQTNTDYLHNLRCSSQLLPQPPRWRQRFLVLVSTRPLCQWKWPMSSCPPHQCGVGQSITMRLQTLMSKEVSTAPISHVEYRRFLILCKCYWSVDVYHNYHNQRHPLVWWSY